MDVNSMYVYDNMVDASATVTIGLVIRLLLYLLAASRFMSGRHYWLSDPFAMFTRVTAVYCSGWYGTTTEPPGQRPTGLTHHQV